MLSLHSVAYTCRAPALQDSSDVEFEVELTREGAEPVTCEPHAYLMMLENKQRVDPLPADTQQQAFTTIMSAPEGQMDLRCANMTALSG